MTKGRKPFLVTVLLSLCCCTTASAEDGSLDELLTEQEKALTSLKQKLAGGNPYQQWGAAQKVVKTVARSTEEVARITRQLEQQRAQLAGDRQQLASDNEILLKELEELKRSKRELAEANGSLAAEKKRLLVRIEQLASRQRLFWMAFYAALALAFLGFGGLLVRVPNSRLERKLKQLEIRELEHRLKQEALKSRTETSRPRSAARPMAERRKTDSKPLPEEPTIANASEHKVRPLSIPEPPQDLVPEKPPVPPGEAANEEKVELPAETTKPEIAGSSTNKQANKPRKRKKK